MIINGDTLLKLAPVKNMIPSKQAGPGGVTFGLGEAGLDIRIKQTIVFEPNYQTRNDPVVQELDGMGNIIRITEGRFTLASAIEEFQMPSNLCAEVKDKSTWARQGLSVFNTVIENGFKGGLTLELAFHGNKTLVVPAGAGIVQVLFYQTSDHRNYTGRYQNQSSNPVPAKFLTGS